MRIEPRGLARETADGSALADGDFVLIAGSLPRDLARDLMPGTTQVRRGPGWWRPDHRQGYGDDQWTPNVRLQAESACARTMVGVTRAMQAVRVEICLFHLAHG